MNRQPAPSDTATISALPLELLLERVAARDRAAFREVYNRASAKLFGVIVRIVPGADAGRDVLQDAFVRIWDRADTFDPAKGSAIAWMATIARNRALDEVRRARPLSLDAMSETFDPPAPAENPLGARERGEQLTALLRCLQALDAERRQIVLLAYYRGASRDELAQRFGHPAATIKTWLRRSLAQLRECLGS